MQPVKEILATFSPYKGSEATASRVKAEIERRWGKICAEDYQPEHNCRTFAEWRKIGYKVKPKEKSIQSITVIKKVNEKGETIKEYPRVVHLFYVTQVTRVA
jgi:hypothetical protein